MTRRERKETVQRKERLKAWTLDPEISENTFQWKNALRHAAQGFAQIVCFQMSHVMQIRGQEKDQEMQADKQHMLSGKTISSCIQCWKSRNSEWRISPVTTYLAAVLLLNLKPSDRLILVFSLVFICVPLWICCTWPLSSIEWTLTAAADYDLWAFVLMSASVTVSSVRRSQSHT